MMKFATLTTATMLAAALSTGTAAAQTGDTSNPYLQSDDSYISISGTIDSVSADTFELDYGEGMVTVEMDDGDRDADAYKLLEGDAVTVSGFVDDDFFEETTIEAGSVYVEKLGTTFYASSIDEEDWAYYTVPVEIKEATLTGTVTDTDWEEFTLSTGMTRITVETEEMAYDPLDDEGYQKIEVGDRVRVNGRIDDDLFEGRELVADWVVTLYNADREADTQASAE